MRKCDIIKINWVVASDNNLIHFDRRPLLKRFKGPYKKSIFIKSIIRGKIENLSYWIHSPCFSLIRNITCNNKGKILKYKNLNFESINIELTFDIIK